MKQKIEQGEEGGGREGGSASFAVVLLHAEHSLRSRRRRTAERELLRATCACTTVTIRRPGRKEREGERERRMNVNGSEPGSSSLFRTAAQKLQELTAFALFVAASSNFALASFYSSFTFEMVSLVASRLNI